MFNPERHIVEEYVTGRELEDYSLELGVDPSFLEGKSVLNYGCGGSNIGRDLKDRGMQTKVYNADILPNPHTLQDESWARYSSEIFKRQAIMARKIRESNDPQMIFSEIEEHENRMLGIEGRNFLQVQDGLRLELADDAIDVTLLLYVLHQISRFEVTEACKEIFRVTKQVVFIFPVSRALLRDLEEAAQQQGFILKKAFNNNMKNTLPPQISTEADLLTTDISGIEDIDYEVSMDDGDFPRSITNSNLGSVVFVKKEYLDIIEREAAKE